MSAIHNTVQVNPVPSSYNRSSM